MTKTRSKTVSAKPFRRSLVMDKSVKSSWKQKMQLKADRRAAKEIADEIRAEKIQKIEDKKRRQQKSRERHEENARKAMIVQKVTNVKKLKRLSKKQMKKIRKE